MRPSKGITHGCLGTAIVAVVLTAHAALHAESMTVTAKVGALQEFGGFGMHPGSLVSGGCRDDIMRMIVKDLKLTWVRFYTGGTSVQAIKNDFNGNVLPQLNTFLEQNPDLFFCMGTAETVDSVHKIAPYTSKWSAVAKWLREEVKLNLKWATIVSEPNADQWWELGYPEGSVHDRRIPVALYPEVVKAQRAAYDAAGLQDVNLYGPEVGSVDAVCDSFVDAILSDDEAYNSLAGWFTKTYNMGPGERMKEVVEEHRRPYFGACGANLMNWYCNEVTQDNDHYAAEMSGRIFNDFNHMITHWAWFHPAQIWTDREAAHRLMWYTKIGNVTLPTTKISDDCSVPISLKYWYLKHLAQTFDVGCRFRYCISDPARPYEDMWWTFGQKPAVAASVARNPDESWTVGIINMAGCISDTLPIDPVNHPATMWTFYEASPYDVTVRVEELVENDDLKFAVYRSNKTLRMQQEDSVTMRDGEMTVSLAPKELVTLRGAKGAQLAVVSSGGRNGGTLDGCGAPYIRPGGVVVVPLAAKGTYGLSVLDVAGRRVCAKKTVRCEGSGEAVFSLAGRATGVYLVRIGSGRAVTRPIVVR
jgi:hypothetical protein